MEDEAKEQAKQLVKQLGIAGALRVLAKTHPGSAVTIELAQLVCNYPEGIKYISNISGATATGNKIFDQASYDLTGTSGFDLKEPSYTSQVTSMKSTANTISNAISSFPNAYSKAVIDDTSRSLGTMPYSDYKISESSNNSTGFLGLANYTSGDVGFLGSNSFNSSNSVFNFKSGSSGFNFDKF